MNGPFLIVKMIVWEGMILTVLVRLVQKYW